MTKDNHPAAGLEFEGLHSKIDMDLEDELGRELTLTESKIVGTAIRFAMGTIGATTEQPSEALEALNEIAETIGCIRRGLYMALNPDDFGEKNFSDHLIQGWYDALVEHDSGEKSHVKVIRQYITAQTDTSAIEYEDVEPIEDYDQLSREELIECCHAHDAHHQEHHDREKDTNAAIRDLEKIKDHANKISVERGGDFEMNKIWHYADQALTNAATIQNAKESEG